MYNTKLITLEESKLISLDILKYVDSFCQKNGITYYGAYGTLLGAVRHRGFIPWDDDIDLFMMRREYEKFVSLFASQEKGKYRCISFENNTFYFPYSKVMDSSTRIIHKNVIDKDNMGIGIDIFPLDYITDSEIEIPIVAKQLLLSKKLLRYSVYNDVNEVVGDTLSISKRIMFYVAKLIGTNALIGNCKRKLKKYTQSDMKKYCGYLGSFIQSYISEFPIEYFSDIVYLDFEDMYIPAPREYKKILEKLYGNYMELPPEDKRIPHAAHAYKLET